MAIHLPAWPKVCLCSEPSGSLLLSILSLAERFLALRPWRSDKRYKKRLRYYLWFWRTAARSSPTISWEALIAAAC
jgi:hypothetical protein